MTSQTSGQILVQQEVQELRDLTSVANDAVDLARDLFTSTAIGSLLKKSDRDFASDLDFKIERAVRDYLSSATPSIGFLGEEEGATEEIAPGATHWVLDPVDGTANLIHGIPLCGISLGLIQGGTPIVGVIDLPLLKERYSAHRGGPALLNGEIIAASTTSSLSTAVISMGDFATGPGADSRNAKRHAISQALAGQVERIRMLGAASIDLAWVAAGRLGGSVMLSNKPWDVAAGVVIARQAGAIVLDVDGSSHGLGSSGTVSVAPKLAHQLIDLISPRLSER